MSFFSPNFGPFLILSLIVFYLAPLRFRPLVLLGASLAFYACSSLPHLGILLGISFLVYLAALHIEGIPAEQQKFRSTTLTLAILLLVLTFFKSAPKFIEQVPEAWNGGAVDLTALLLAPLGLSYYLFKLLGYLLDVYWEKLPAQRNFASLLLYASFFPQIVSGPIQRAESFLSQQGTLPGASAADFVVGLRRILFGVFKKVVIADELGIVVDRVFATPASYSSLELLAASYCFAFQLYADFSGLTDIALGIGKLFGIHGPENFDLPYLARNIPDFWRRWHMSLTSWLQDYLFLPLRMSLRHFGNVGLGTAIFVNMLAVGLWHSPTWTFAAFGSLNGVYLVVSAFTLKRRNAFFQKHPWLRAARTVAGPVLTFHLMVFAFIFARASSLTAAVTYVHQLFFGFLGPIPVLRMHWAIPGLTRNSLLLAVASLVALETIDALVRTQRLTLWPIASLPRTLRWALYYGILALILFESHATKGFIYANF